MTEQKQPQKQLQQGRRNLQLLVQLLLIVGAMFAFGYAMVPMYRLICDITGVGIKGKNSAMRIEASAIPKKVDLSRTVTVEFLTTLNQNMNWDFRPELGKIKVHPGQLSTVNFYARNRTAQAVVAQAIPNIAPLSASKFLHKTECFCFRQQHFAAGESRDMPVVFVLDPDLPADVDTVTLSYTFFDATQLAAAQNRPAGIN